MDSVTLEKLRVVERAERTSFTPPVPSGPVTPADVAAYFHSVEVFSYEGKQLVRESWILKTAGNSAICFLKIANCGISCDVCLSASTFLPPTARGGLNTEYSVKERAQLETWFEEDVLRKITEEVKLTRLSGR